MTPCPSCGAAAPTEATWCEACGTELGAVPLPACVACGEHAVADDGYCGSCGHKQPGARDHMELVEGPVAAVTDRGLRHHHNEDAMAISSIPGVGAVLVVCDGVSSTSGSATASQVAADAARDLLVDRLVADPTAELDGLLAEATAAAQIGAAAVPAVISNDPRAQGGPPSTTFVAAVVRTGPGRVTIDTGWVGDSRAYWVSDGQAIALTEDHEIGGSLIRWLGADSYEPHAEVSHLVAEEPGRLVVCSDGLWRYADPPIELARLIARLEADNPSSQGLAAALVDHALAGGGHDNITVAVWNSRDEAATGARTTVTEPAKQPDEEQGDAVTTTEETDHE